MSVHFKFKSNLDHDTVTFDGLSISVADLKKSIMQQKKIGKSSDFDLQITNAQTKEVYDSDDMLVPKNTSVIVARVPVAGGAKKNWDKPDLPLPIDEDDLGQIRYDRIAKSADLVNANTTEEDKVKAMITQSSQEYDPSKYVKSRSMTGPLPPTYTCYRCGKQGHWIKNCPTNNPDVKRSTGIPRSFMVPVDGPEHKGALLTSTGDYAVPLIDHQAYKEVKKEKPPFVPQEEPEAEPEAQIPEELLCMVCKDLLQDAVLIPCCGNSFCDECVRQVLLESDNHECPECHETEVSPNTLIPNRFLRTAVLNFKNETGYTRMKKITLASAPVPIENPVSPQPSPDSTVESQNQSTDNNLNVPEISAEKKESSEKITLPADEQSKDASADVGTASQVNSPKTNVDDDCDIQPGTPLADEPPLDVEPIQAIGQEQYTQEKYDYHSNHSSSRYSHNYRDDYYDNYREESGESDPKPISTIETITNARKSKYGRPAPVRQQFPSQRPHTDDRSDSYSRDRDDYHSREDYHRFDRHQHSERGSQRTGHHSRYERSARESRYHHTSDSQYSRNDERANSHYSSGYESHGRGEEPTRRHGDRYRSVSQPVHLPHSVPVYPVASVPAVPAVPAVIPAPQVYVPQPPPPGASPVDSLIAAQPPPPGVGPLLPPVSSDLAPYGGRLFDSKDSHKDSASKIDNRSIDDKMEAFQRQLAKRDRESKRDDSRSRSSSDRERSRSSSRSRSYPSSKSWSRSSRSTHRSSRSRSRTSFSSRSRSRSYSHSRSRSWSKPRSYSRSRSRSRTASSRSRSRSRTTSRFRRRVDSRDRVRSSRPRSHSRSRSPKEYRHATHRNIPYAGRHSYTPPNYPPSYQSHYGAPPALGIPVLRPEYPPHIHPVHPAVPPIHSRPVIDRQPKCPPPYPEVYPVYDMYQHQHQRFDREQRVPRYEKRQDYQKDFPRQHPEVIAHRIPGYIGDRSRDWGQTRSRYRTREPRKDIIRELPQISEQEMRTVHTKETSEDSSSKKREEKSAVKHKKHHHHHKSKENKKQESKTQAITTSERHVEPSKTNVKEDSAPNRTGESKSGSEVVKSVKSAEKVKDKKHKHKKHKLGEQTVKKKKSVKKEKDTAENTECELHPKVKVKKKKVKTKVAVEMKQPEVVETVVTEVEVPEEISVETPLETEKVETVAEVVNTNSSKSHDVSADTLDIFADEGEAVILESEALVEEEVNDSENVAFETEEVNEAENIDNAVYSEEEIEETVEDESNLHVDVPALSKWEREEIEDDVETKPQRKNTIVLTKEEKGSLSSDIIQRAELAILSKPLKPQISSKDKNDSKSSSGASSPIASPLHKEPELKSVVKTDRLSSPALQVTISTIKEKRSVHSRKDERISKDSNKGQLSKKIKLDRSNFSRKPDERSISSYSSKIRDSRERNADKYIRRRSPMKDLASELRTASRDKKDNRRFERDSRYVIEPMREERRHRYEDKYFSNREVPSHREDSRSDRRKVNESVSRSSKFYDKDYIQQFEKSRRGNQRSRSRSIESEESYSSSKFKHSSKLQLEHSEKWPHPRTAKEESHSSDKPRRKHSPIKAPEKHSSETTLVKKPKKDFHDDLKFEPDYDAFSDVDEKVSERKRKSMTPEINRKRLKIEKRPAESGGIVEKSSDSESSSVSESDSSDSDDQKGSRSKNSDSEYKQKHKKSKHKKHKKHKHKHKKKKSHKSKRE